MRVLLTGDTVGGVWTFVLELAASLLRRGIEVHLAAIGPELSKAQREEANSISGLQWSWRPSKLEWMDNPWSEVCDTGLWLRQLSNEFRPDLVHLNTLSYGDVEFGAPIVQTVHSCVSCWWSAVKQEAPPPRWSYYRRHVTASLLGADFLAAPSYASLCETAGQYPIDITQAAVIHNGLEQSKFAPAPKEPLILSAGRLWDEAKNISLLVEAAGKVEWPVVLAGSGAASSAGTCRLLGAVGRAELREWQAKAAIYVSPAKYEPFGLCVLEAALSGCALVLSDIPSFREIWGDSATFIQPDDGAGLLTALRWLIRDDCSRQAMAERATQRARRYSAERMTDEYLSVYSRARIWRTEEQPCAL